MNNTFKNYKECPLQIFQSNKGPITEICAVRVEKGQLTIDYKTKVGERFLWRCTELTPGHYKCETENVNLEGYASLHRFIDGNIFEGHLKVKGNVPVFDGMWRIVLGKPCRVSK